MELSNMEKNLPNGKNMGGLASVFYMVDVNDVETFPTLPADDVATMDNARVVKSALILKTGKELSKIYGTPGAVGLKEPDQGELDGISQKPSFTFFHPGATDKVLGFTQFTNNKSFLVIAQDAEQRWILIGSEQYPLNKTAADGFNTGAKAEDLKGASFQFDQAGSHGPSPRIPEEFIPFPSESSGSGSDA